MRRRVVLHRFLIAACLSTLGCPPLQAQLNGENLLGDFGVNSGTQAAPGLYLSGFYYRYNTSTIKDGDGNRVAIDPGQPGSQTINAFGPVALYVTTLKVLGANYAAMAVMPFANATIEAPALGLVEETGTAAGDLYLVPIQLGWHSSRADVVASFGLFAPTGRYTAGGSDNIGKGMWSYELAAGGTLFLDGKKTLSLATTGFWEIHSAKEGELTVGPVTLTDVKVGQLLTLEGGVAKSFLDGGAHAGVAYYAQWKITEDDFGSPVPLPVEIAKHRVFGVGPDVTIPIAVNSRLIALVNARYLWETGARAKTEGESLVLTATFPVPSIEIPTKSH
jgi:hypothetical protein